MANIIQLTDFNDPRLDVYARLSEAQLLNREHPEEGIFIAESPKVIDRALDAGCIPLSVLVEDKHVEGEAKEVLARCGGIPVFAAPFDLLTQLTGFKLTRGLLCAMRRPICPTVAQVCQNARRVAVLENVMNTTNVGAIFRSAAALNMDAVLLTNGCSDPLYRRSIRVSMGTVFQVPWAWLEGDIAQLKELGFKTAAMALSDNSVTIKDEALLSEERLAIVLGTEGDGLAEKTIADCDYTVRIPTTHGVDSLNVAAASAVAFWQLGQ
ncbi:MAG: RNA methyltransferase [Oscillospiraceae bacterium]|nr:RNA methyltransferase [Oscillospiraceae bacterium]